MLSRYDHIAPALTRLLTNTWSQAKFHKLKREVIEDVRHIFPHGQILVSELS